MASHKNYTFLFVRIILWFGRICGFTFGGAKLIKSPKKENDFELVSSRRLRLYSDVYLVVMIIWNVYSFVMCLPSIRAHYSGFGLKFGSGTKLGLQLGPDSNKAPESGPGPELGPESNKVPELTSKFEFEFNSKPNSTLELNSGLNSNIELDSVSNSTFEPNSGLNSTFEFNLENNAIADGCFVALALLARCMHLCVLVISRWRGYDLVQFLLKHRLSLKQLLIFLAVDFNFIMVITIAHSFDFIVKVKDQ